MKSPRFGIDIVLILSDTHISNTMHFQKQIARNFGTLMVAVVSVMHVSFSELGCPSSISYRLLELARALEWKVVETRKNRLQLEVSGAPLII